MKTPTRYIVIDDDKVNNLLCCYTIRKTEHESKIKIFDIPEKGFEYITNEYSKTGNKKSTVLFLDINMPNLTGWDFLKKFEKLDAKIKDQIRVFMLSSSVDPKDKERAYRNKNVVDFISKPLYLDVVSKIKLSYNVL